MANVFGATSTTFCFCLIKINDGSRMAHNWLANEKGAFLAPTYRLSPCSLRETIRLLPQKEILTGCVTRSRP
jgi:hypothetical protein